MSGKKINRYALVHEIARLAKEKEQEDRLRLVDKKSAYIKTINEVEKKRNYVLEAYNEIEERLNNDKPLIDKEKDVD